SRSEIAASTGASEDPASNVQAAPIGRGEGGGIGGNPHDEAASRIDPESTGTGSASRPVLAPQAARPNARASYRISRRRFAIASELPPSASKTRATGFSSCPLGIFIARWACNRIERSRLAQWHKRARARRLSERLQRVHA